MLKEKLNSLLSEREVIIRRDGEVKYLSLGKKTLGLAYSLASLIIASVAFGGYSYYDLTEELEANNQKINHLEKSKSKLAKILYRSNNKLQTARTELDQQYDRMEQIVGERKNLHQTLKSVHANLQRTTSDRNNSAEYASSLESKIGSLTNNLTWKSVV